MSHQSLVRGIDHLVIASHDLDQLAAFYRALGFTVGPRNRHPWGTENHIVQFDGAFLELIGIGNRAAIPAASDGRYSFGAFVQDFIAGGEGLAMLALESGNAVADAETFRKARIGAFEPFYFERMGRTADGSETKVSFTLAFAQMEHAPRAGFFVCQQHQPHAFWNAALQQHPGGAFAIENVVLIAEDPSDTHEFLGAFTGQREMRATSYGLDIATSRGGITVLSALAFEHRYGCAPQRLAGAAAVFAAIDFKVSSLSRQKALMVERGISFHMVQDRLVIAVEHAYGVASTFSE